jgi:hypothetical protein
VARPSKFGHQVNTHQVVLTCSGQTITLPSPDFDNAERFAFDRVNHRSRGGDLIIFRDSIWPKAQTLIYQWTRIDSIDRAQLLTFLRKHLGKLVTITDYEGRVFTGIITNPDTEFSQSKRSYHDVKLEFEIE